ncbi:MAG: tRNA lysidine(34) synthetase TilS [Acidaminococcaceae bacterium]
MAEESTGLKLEWVLKKQELFPKGAVLLAACSGGADSLAMTSVLQQVGKEEGWQIFVCHVQHHLRGEEAESDALFVEKFCRERNLPFIRLDVDVKLLAAQEKLSIEEAARKLRYRVLKETCLKLNAAAIVTGHHQDDQAETVLMNLLRGAGTRGLRGMQTRNGLVVRPFLDAARKDMEDYCMQQGIVWCTDSSNECTDYRRNSIRKELLPMLEKYNPQIRKLLATTAYLAAQDQEYLEELANNYLRENSVIKNGAYILCVKGFLEMAPALSTRVLMLAFQNYADNSDGQLERKHVEALRQLIKKGKSGKGLSLPGVRAEYAYGYLTISRLKTEVAEEKFAAVLNVPGQLQLPNDGGILTVTVVIGNKPIPAINQAVYPSNLVTGIIEVRNRKNGDKFRKKNGYVKKLKEYLIDAKIPKAERERLLLICSGSEVLWVLGKQAAGWKESTDFQEWLLLEIAEGGK